MIQHVIFDCDGVLLDTEIVAAEVMSAWLRDQGLNISADQFIREHTGKTFTGIIKELISMGKFSEEIDIATGVRQIETQVKSDIRLVEGLKEALPKIEIPKSVVSNSNTDYVRSSLDRFSIGHHFGQRIFSSEMVEKPKPSPLVYELAVESIGLPKEEIVVVEDSMTGVQAAIDAGLKVIGFLGGSHILQGHRIRLLESGASSVVDDYKALVDHLSLG